MSGEQHKLRNFLICPVLLCTPGHTHALFIRSPQTQVGLHSTEKARDFPWWQVKTLNVVCGHLSTEAALCRLDIRLESDLLFTNLEESTWPRGFCTRGISRLQTSSASLGFLRKSMFLRVTNCVGSLANLL